MARPGTVADALTVLICDDEKNIRSTLAVCLEGLGCRPVEASSGDEAVAAIRRESPDLAFLDLRLEKEKGLEVLPRLLAERPQLEVVIVTAFATYETAVEALNHGARDYLPKPFTPAQIRHVVERVRERRALEGRVQYLESRLAQTTPDSPVEPASPAMRAAVEAIARAAEHDVPVLLTGESGTGKGVLARQLHAASARRNHPFVVVNCPTLSEELLASELFGHVKGSFTGAIRDQAGRVEAAEKGTLFLDEIAELTSPLQAKLLRFLQEKRFERLGENRTREADVRVVAATNRDLDVEVEAGRFRRDLLYRLNTVEVKVPPLRERREDILPFAKEFLAFFARSQARGPFEFSPEAERALLAWDWPGNVRELRNAVERAVIFSSSRVIGPESFPGRLAAAPATRTGAFVGGDFTMEEIEREHVLRVLARAPTQEKAAEILGIDASTLWRKRKRYEEG